MNLNTSALSNNRSYQQQHRQDQKKAAEEDKKASLVIRPSTTKTTSSSILKKRVATTKKEKKTKKETGLTKEEKKASKNKKRSKSKQIIMGEKKKDEKEKPKRSSSRSKSPGKHKSRSKSRSKSPGKHKSRSKSRSKSPGKHKSRRDNNKSGWWDLENDPELIAMLEAEGLRDKARIAEQEALLERRSEIVRLFKEQHMKKRREQEKDASLSPRSTGRGKVNGGVAARFLQQVQQKERAVKPTILENVRAKPLKIDVMKWEAPKWKKEAQEKTLIKTTAKNHFLFKEDKPPRSASPGAAARAERATTNATAMIIKAFEPVQYKEGNTIIQQGQKDDHMYVVEDGTVQFQVNNNVVATGGAGTTFGDQNLLHSSPAKASVIAAQPMKVFRLHQETYRGILQQKHLVEEVKHQQQKKEREQQVSKSPGRGRKPVLAADLLGKKSSSKEDEEWWKDSKRVQLQVAIRKALEKVQQDELERITVLGEGQFGEVWLVGATINVKISKNKKGWVAEKDRHEFALKLQSTHDEMREEMAVTAIKSEIKAMKALSDHPFVATLYKSYETEENMDMLLGLIPGGELWDVIHKEDEATGDWFSGISEGDARFYSLVVADTLGYLHSKKYIFRDLKPENIMIDGKGYPMIVDFGFCKYLAKGANTGKTFTFCGTPNYVAPEIVRNQGHNAAADYWALGVVIFEMIEGENPFYYDDMEQMELYRAICEDPPEKLDEKAHSKQVRNLIDEMLVKDPKLRITTKGIIEHAWYEGLSLKKLRARKIKAPWKPSGGEDDDDDDEDEEAEAAAAAERQRRQEEELKRLEEEERQRQSFRKQKELEERIRRAEEEKERQRQIQLELQREREKEEERRRLEEEERERQCQEEELRKQLELEEQRRLEEDKERQRQEELRQQQKLEEQLRREEEEERQRQEELDEQLRREEEEARQRQEELDEQRRREEEAERQRVAEEKAVEEAKLIALEEERIAQEEAEEEARLKALEEERIAEEEAAEAARLQALEEQRIAEEEAYEAARLQALEEERIAKEEAARLEEQRIKQEKAARKAAKKEKERLLKQQEEMENQRRLEEELQRHEEEAAAASAAEEKDEMYMDDVFDESHASPGGAANNTSKGSGRQIRSLHESFNGFTSPRKTPKTSIEDLVSPVPKGIVDKMIKENANKSPRSNRSNPDSDARKSVKRGLVQQRLSAAKANEKSENIPSLFSSFSLFD